ncbi:hypothetical protein [Methylotenera sp.]|uniref:hypothetical protein n=1 Tax=Methylotenera sp. TaxID=2051956 RepID=UPI002486DCAB|nr:hypothetical protein [Methylotenera sp.]MDI1300044.1 hypothetical protein [Methylotenera sp.]
MPIRPEAFDQVAQNLAPLLAGLPPKVVAIDGRSGAGKTTLGRFLAWHFNSSLVELDLFLGEGCLVRRENEVERIVKLRLNLGRPVFVEGLLVLDLLDSIGVKPDYTIYVQSAARPNGCGFAVESTEYENRRSILASVNQVVELHHEG